MRPPWSLLPATGARPVTACVCRHVPCPPLGWPQLRVLRRSLLTAARRRTTRRSAPATGGSTTPARPSSATGCSTTGCPPRDARRAGTRRHGGGVRHQGPHAASRAVPVAVATPDLPAQAADLAATWLGHATVLLEVEGHWVLTDPVWSDRVSPSRDDRPAPQPPGADVARRPAAARRGADLPRPLRPPRHRHHRRPGSAAQRRTRSVRGPARRRRSTSAAGACPTERIVELDWDESHRVGGLTFTCTEARHFSGRSLGSNTTLWSSWVIAGEQRRVFFGGDRGYTPGVRRDRRAARPVRPDDAADRRLRRPLARRTPRPGGGGARPPRAPRRACCCRSTGPPSTSPSTSGRDPVEWVRDARRRARRRPRPARLLAAGSSRRQRRCPSTPWWRASV